MRCGRTRTTPGGAARSDSCLTALPSASWTIRKSPRNPVRPASRDVRHAGIVGHVRGYSARMVSMSLRPVGRFLIAALVTLGALLSAPMPVTPAQPCPDVEAVFARGTGEPPGVGGIGEPFIDALRSAVGPRSLDVYPVNYDASSNFSDRIEFAQSFLDGVKDATSHIEATAANCPKTRIVLGGYSQGAAVAGAVPSASVPAGVPAEYLSF